MKIEIDNRTKANISHELIDSLPESFGVNLEAAEFLEIKGDDVVLGKEMVLGLGDSQLSLRMEKEGLVNVGYDYLLAVLHEDENTFEMIYGWSKIGEKKEWSKVAEMTVGEFGFMVDLTLQAENGEHSMRLVLEMGKSGELVLSVDRGNWEFSSVNMHGQEVVNA